MKLDTIEPHYQRNYPQPLTRSSVFITTNLRLGIVVVAMAISTLCLSGCATSSPLEDLFERKASVVDTLPPETIVDSIIVDTSVRYVGTDSEFREYYVGTNEEGDTCLLVYGGPDVWGSGCGTPGEFSVEILDTVAWLFTDSFGNHESDEVINNVVHIGD